tara:strand:+ start:2077 stop:4209 length:2133 start_codon:yes stop_codon:yes gene_type:complete
MLQKENDLKSILNDKVKDNNLDSFSSTISEITTNYENYNYYTWETVKGTAKNMLFFIIPSPTQRFKTRPTAEEPEFSTTWNVDDMASGLLSWMTQTIKPTVWLNIRLWLDYGMTLIYDGETKIHFIKNFIDNQKVFKVLEKKGRGYTFTQSIVDFKAKLSTYSEHGATDIMRMLNEFKSQRGVEHTDEYLTSQWMIDNDYEFILDRLKNHKVTVILEDLEPGVESDVYQILGSAGAEQTCSQLSMSHVKSNMWRYLYHRDGKPDNKIAVLFDKMAYVVSKPKAFAVLPGFFKQLMNQDDDGYKEYDVYLYNLLVFSFLSVDDNGKLMFNSNLDYDNLLPRFVRWKKSEKENGNVLFFKRRTAAFDRLEKFEQETIINQLTKKVIPMLDEILLRITHKDYHSIWRKTNKPDGNYPTINSDISTNWKKVKSHVPVTDTVRAALNFLKDDVGSNVSILMTLQYLVSADSLNDSNAKEAYDIVIKTFKEKYADYIFSRETKSLAENAHGLESGRNHLSQNKPNAKYHSLGAFLALLGKEAGLGMDTTAHLHKQFFIDRVIHELNQKYGDVLSTTKARRLMLDKWDLDGYNIDQFKMVNPHGDIYGVDYMDIGHTKQNLDGNELTVTNFIVENRGKNQGKYKYVDKDQVMYYSLCKKKLAELREEAKRIDDDDMLDAVIKATRTLNWLVEYHGIELDETIEFDEEGYIVLQKDAA